MSLLKPIISVASAVWLLAANSALESPRLGYLRLADGDVRSLRGMAGAFYLGERTAASVLQHAFNGSAGVRTLEGSAEFLGPNGEVMRIARIDGEVRAIGLSAIEDTAYVLTETELWRLSGQRADRYAAPDLQPGERIAGISGAGDYIDLAIVVEEQVTLRRYWVETGDSIIRHSFGGNAAQVLFLPHAMILWTESATVHLRRADGSEVSVDCGAEIASVASMSPQMVHVATVDGRQYALRISGDPVVPQTVEARLLPLPESAE
ncbi:hypothetical protein F183_A17600 [Bryobacterales bacterium F-183]|nr:hypothetical protein F183_A17600 [Bryobacterales bacterium F-183]